MKIELLVSPGCPAREETESILTQVLSELAPESIIQTIIVDSSDKAVALKFSGSPTVRINGRDIEPEAEKSLNYTLA